MDVQVSGNVLLSDSSSAGRTCVWSGETINGPHVRIISQKGSNIGSVAFICIEHVEALADAINQHYSNENHSQYEITPLIYYMNENVLDSYTDGSKRNHCIICERHCEGDVYKLGRALIHVQCIEEFVQILKEDVWEYSDEILSEEFSQ